MINLGIVGTGWIAERFIEAARNEKRINISACLSRKIETAQTFAKKNNIQHPFDNIDIMCQSKQIDAVYIASPNSVHSEQAITFLNNGIHVLCEKPLAANAKQAERMIETAKKNGVVLMEAVRITVSPVFKAILSNIQKIGPIHKYVGLFGQYSSKFERYNNGENFSSLSSEYAGGCLMDIGIYCIYPMAILFGEPKTTIASGSLGRTNVDLEASVVCQYDNLTCIISASKMSNSIGCSEIEGELGTILIDKMATMQSARIVYRDGSIEELASSPFENDLIYEVTEFYEVIHNKKQESTINTHSASLISMKVLDAARKQIGVPIDFE